MGTRERVLLSYDVLRRGRRQNTMVCTAHIHRESGATVARKSPLGLPPPTCNKQFDCSNCFGAL